MKLIDLALAAVCTAALAFTAYMLANSWGGTSWLLDTVSGTAVLVLVLLRRRWRPAPAAALATALAAALLARLLDCPQAPGPATALALAALVAWSVPRSAFWIPAAALGVVIATYATAWPDDRGFTAVTVINAVAWAAGLVAGLAIRLAPASPAA
ncbi:metal transporter [Dactylosporangium vinaceum]|uniref:Metal transporter n=1 Tax=Dactylosporangium vinaceum TaxID=53362 RepID=A0ABV5MF98_9ACTN|nr:hypothetical protein [Dactylosporangium vinaceum]UAB98685.1 metal transporter [Dactylosporangium vinaceum]